MIVKPIQEGWHLSLDIGSACLLAETARAVLCKVAGCLVILYLLLTVMHSSEPGHLRVIAELKVDDRLAGLNSVLSHELEEAGCTGPRG